jgi:hypothetical protein
MDRARRAGWTALIVVVMVGALAGWGGMGVLAAVPAWPPSTLVVSEVQTGGASASDEFVEVANQGSAPVDLTGLEVVYATSSGSTVTRKATWTAATTLDPGRRILLANAAGVYATVADATYSGGFAATGVRGAAGRRRFRRSTRSVGGMRPVHSSRGRLLRRRQPAPALSAPRVDQPATAPTRTTTSLTGSCRRRHRHRVSPRRRYRTLPRRRPRPRPSSRPRPRRRRPRPRPARRRRLARLRNPPRRRALRQNRPRHRPRR